jgi:hypothetical protein
MYQGKLFNKKKHSTKISCQGPFKHEEIYTAFPNQFTLFHAKRKLKPLSTYKSQFCEIVFSKRSKNNNAAAAGAGQRVKDHNILCVLFSQRAPRRNRLLLKMINAIFDATRYLQKVYITVHTAQYEC